MMIRNNPFALNPDEPVWGYNGNEQVGNRISLEEAMNMIPRVGFEEFYDRIGKSLIHAYLYHCYYMHYLCIIGDTIRLRNFIIYLRVHNMDPVKVCNYNLLPEFDFGTCLHTAARWNSDPEIFSILREECEGDLRMPDGSGFTPSEAEPIPLSVYKNPFTDILGDGERIFDRFKLYRRLENDFEEMISYLNGIERELDAEDEAAGRGEGRGENAVEEEEDMPDLVEELEEGEVVEEEEEEEIEVILEHNNYNDFAADMNNNMNMNNEINNNNVGPFDWNVDNMIIQEDEPEPQPLIRQNAVVIEDPLINQNLRNVRRRLF